MRRFTLITLILLFVALALAAIFQLLAATGPRRFPGPGVSISPTSTSTETGVP